MPQETTKSHKTTQRSVVKGETTAGEGTEPNKRTADEQRSPQRRACCGELNCPSDSEALEERIEKERSDLGAIRYLHRADSWSSLSDLYIPSQFVIVFPFSSLFSRCSLFTPDSSFPLLRFLVSPLYTTPTPLKLLPTSLRGQPGHIVRLATLTSLCPRFLCSPLSPPSFFSIYFLPLLPPFSSASPLLRPYCLSRCLPKVARPNVAAPFVAIAQSGRLPPCRAPLAWCRL